MGLVWAESSAALTWIAIQRAGQAYMANLEQHAHATLTLIEENLKGEVAKFHNAPSLIARNPAIIRVLREPSTFEELKDVNRVVGASVTYLVDAHGLTVAASNWASPRSFVGGSGVGWRLARMTGDYNGVHRWDCYARLFAFPRAFFHPQMTVDQ